MTRSPALLVALVPLMVACASANTSPPRASPSEADNFASFGVGGLTPGAKILISKNNQWLPGTVVRQAAPGHYRVHYEGFGPEWDESVPLERIRPQQDAAGTAARDYRVGDKVLVKMQNRLLLGDVVQQISATSWRVHYDGYGPEVAENVGPDRMRKPHSGASSHGVGESVGIDLGGRVMPAKVLAVVATDRWIVRFDGFGPEYDQEVGAERVQPAPKAPEAPPATTAPPAVATTPPDAAKGKDKGSKDKDKGKGKDKAPASAPEPAAVVPSGPPQVGEAVLVAHRGAFYAGTIAAVAPGGFRVKYDSAAATGAAEEEVPGDRIARLTQQPKGTPYTPNQKVFIEWHGMYFPGKVVKEQEKGQYRVRYEGTGPEADEIVISKRVRPRP